MGKKRDRIIYSVSVADVQEIADQLLGRELTPEELKLIEDELIIIFLILLGLTPSLWQLMKRLGIIAIHLSMTTKMNNCFLAERLIFSFKPHGFARCFECLPGH